MAHPAKADSHADVVLKRLEALVQRSPELAGPVAFYRMLLPVLREAQAGVAPFTLAADTAERKLESGLPLLVGEDLPLDVEATRRLFLHLCRLVENISAGGSVQSGRSGWSLFARGRTDPRRSSDDARSGNGREMRPIAARQIRQAIERNELDLAVVWSALATGDWQQVESTTAGLDLDTELLRTLAENSLKPSLRVWSRGLKYAAVGLDDWQRGQCPMCGSSPLFAEIQGKEGARHLRCGVCGANWYYPRLQCPFCRNHDHRTLGTISVEGEEEKYHVQTCDQCRGYLKVVVTFDPTPVDLLMVEDLATLHLDLIAVERQYARVPVRSDEESL